MKLAGALGAEEALARCILFQALEPAARGEIAARAHHRHLPAGTPIFRSGDPGDSMMAIAAGTVRISMPTVPGREVVLADLLAGEVFGEVALLDGGGRSADATALTNCHLLQLDRRDVVLFLSARPEACLKLLPILCQRLRRADQRMADIAFLDLPARIAKTLLARTEGAAGKAAPRLALSQTDLASMVGASRENVNRHLRDWQRRGILESRKGWIVVRDREGLEDLADPG